MAERLDSLAFSSASFLLSGSSSSTDGSYQPLERVEGFDYEFVPPPDPKYECVICLLVLREPQQTRCGHRFCKACITKWLRESNKTCPVDNAKIVEEDLFADNFAKREILNFRVHCPNKSHGCEKIDILCLIQKHTDECPFSLIPCPNSCSDILLRQDLINHLSTVCCYRQVSCSHCGLQITFNDLPKHNIKCPEVNVTCDHCGVVLARKLLIHHENTDCSKAVISCNFHPLGCQEKMERALSGDHMKSAMTDHLNMLCSEVVQISRRLGLPTGRNYVSASVERNNTNSLHATQMSEELLSQMVPVLSQLSLGPHSSDQSEASGDFRADTQEVHESYSSNKGSDFQQLQNMPSSMFNKNVTDPYYSSNNSNYSDSDFKFLKKQNSLQDESLAHHSHDISELKEKCRDLERINRDLKQKYRVLEGQIDEKDGRLCNGIYFWKIKEYQKLRREAQIGNTPAIHSPPFYSSYYGYKLCVRVNLNGIDSAKGSFLSIFVHFLQGDFDDLLEWPFTGRIILSVVDQNTVSEYRSPIVETLIAKPSLAAFQRPAMARNHKGFGYMEFVPLNILDRGHFVKNDTLIIKAHVIPNG